MHHRGAHALFRRVGPRAYIAELGKHAGVPVPGARTASWDGHPLNARRASEIDATGDRVEVRRRPDALHLFRLRREPSEKFSPGASPPNR